MHLGRSISDSTWYRVNRKLTNIGIEKKEYPEVLKTIGRMNRKESKSSNHKRIVIVNENFFTIWNNVKSFKSKHPNMQISCEDFRKILIGQMRYLPPDRYRKDGKYLGISTMWYRWFKAGGIAYRAEQRHPILDFVGVACAVLTWHENQRLKHPQPQETKQFNLLGENNV